MRETWVDYAKGIGIILVVFGHVNRGLYSSGIYLSESVYHLMDSVIYSFHMPLFFFLSGLFFSSSLNKKGKSKFLISKIDTIVYPYVVWSILQGSVGLVLSKYTNTPFEINDIIFILTQPRSQFWFLYALFMVFIVATVLYKKEIFNSTLPTLIVISAVLYVFQNSITSKFHFNYITGFMVFFLSGAMAVRYSSAISSVKISTTVGMLCLFALLEFHFHRYLGLNYTNIGFYSLLIALVSIGFIVCFSVVLSRASFVWLRRIGEMSMAIYLMHILAGSGVRIVLSRLLHVNDWLLHVTVGVLIGLVLPTIAFFAIQRFHLGFLLERPKDSRGKHNQITY